MNLLFLIGKCLAIGIIWAALLSPVFFRKGGAIKYIILVSLVSAATYFLPGHRALIAATTMIALIALIVSWILSMAVFDKDSKLKSKIISFACIISGFSYLIYVLFAAGRIPSLF